MPRTIVLDGLERGQVVVSTLPDGTVRVEALYGVKAGAEVVKQVSRDTTALLTPAQQAALLDAYNAVFAAVEAAELT